MSESFKHCAICQSRSAGDARHCANCGASLENVAAFHAASSLPARRQYDFRYGETDLLESAAHEAARKSCLVLLLFAVMFAFCGVVGLLQTESARRASSRSQPLATVRPTLPPYATVTMGPPTATVAATTEPTLPPTPSHTPAPCARQVVAGDSLIGIIAGCGHRSLALLPTVMALNGIADETRIQVGQRIIVPRPTPTLNPDAASAPAGEASASEDDAGLALLSFDPFAPTIEPTLLPGLMWHTVAKDENMILIALQYKSNAKQLSDLNPEVEFALCDFGLEFGGGECRVNLAQGQRIRVPAPTATPTIAPTSDGSETPTPTVTATINAPHAYSPIDETIFTARDQITLRWVATGSLNSDQLYLVSVENDAGDRFSAETRDLFFILPPRWQAADSQLHGYTWSVTIVDSVTGEASSATEPSRFFWQGAGQASS